MAERDDDGFLARWSRRKHTARQEASEAAASALAPQEPSDAPEAPAPDQPTEIVELPDPETLDASSDFSVFLRRDVPLETHQKALRRLWRLDPIYNRIDGLDDYAEDYTDQAKGVKGLRTAYKVGRGFLEQIAEAEEQPTAAAPAEPPADESTDPGPAPGDPEPSKQASDAPLPRTRRSSGEKG